MVLKKLTNAKIINDLEIVKNGCIFNKKNQSKKIKEKYDQ